MFLNKKIKKLYFQSRFWFTEKLSRKNRVPICSLCPTHMCSPLHISIPHQSGAFVIFDEPTLAHHHPRSTISIRVHSWCCIFCIFGQMYNDIYLPLEYHIEYFHRPKKSCVLYLFNSASFFPPQPLIFYCLEDGLSRTCSISPRLSNW